MIKNSIGREDSLVLVKQSEKLKKDLTETRAALLSYKNMQNVVAEQVKSLKLMHERKRNENESLIQTLRDIQAESPDKQKFGKLYYVVMLSRWQEAAVNKRYDLKVTESKELRGEILNLNQLLDISQRDHHNAETESRRVKQ
jgi:hypothetical protein